MLPNPSLIAKKLQPPPKPPDPRYEWLKAEMSLEKKDTLKEKITQDLNAIASGELLPSNLSPYGKKGKCLSYFLGTYSTYQDLSDIEYWLKEQGYSGHASYEAYRGLPARYRTTFVLILPT